MIVGMGNGKIKHVRCLNFCDLLEHGHKFREIVELGKAGLGPVAGALRRKLNGRDGFPEGRSPRIKMNELISMQCAILEVFLHGIHLYHGIADRGAGGEDNAMASGQLVQITALHIQVAGFLCLRLADTADVAHFCERGEVFIVMRFVDEQAVNAQFLKGYDVILAGLVVEPVQLCLNLLLAAFQLLDGEAVAAIVLDFHDAVHDFVHLLLEHFLLACKRERNLFQLAVADDDGVIVAGGDASAEALAVLGFKVLCRGHKDIGARVELQVFRGPLLCEVVRHNDQTLLAEAQALALLRQSHHCKGLTGTDHMAQKLVASVKAAGNRVELMPTKTDLRIDAGETQVAAVVFTGSNRVELLIVKPGQALTSRWVFPYPLLKRLLDLLLLGLRDGGLFLVQHGNTSSLCVLNIVEDPHVLQVEGLLQNLIAVDAVCAKGAVCPDIPAVAGLALNVPLAGIGREMNLDLPAGIKGRAEKLIHEILIVLRGNPGRAHADGDFRRRQVHRLHLLQRLHIGGKKLRGSLRMEPCCAKLLPDIAGEVFVSGEILALPVSGACLIQRIQKDDTAEIVADFLLRFVAQLHHIIHIHMRFLCQRNGQCLGGSIHMGDFHALLDRAPGEHIRLADKIALIVQHLQRGQQEIGVVRIEHRFIGTGVDDAVLCAECVVQRVQPCLLRLNHGIGVILRLIGDELAHALPDADQALDPALSGDGGIDRCHAAVFPVVDLSVYESIAEIADGGVGRDREVFVLFGQLLRFIFGEAAADALHRLGQQLAQVLIRIGNTGGLRSVGSADLPHFAQDHFRVIDKILVHPEPVCVGIEVNPVRLLQRQGVPLL